jgi:hypothetical protein
MNMLVFHSHCQMGNQMFIYACARSLAKKRKLAYCLSEISHLKYFKLSDTDRYNRLKFLSFKIQNKIPGLQYRFEHFQDNRVDYSKEMELALSQRIWYYGYFQGEAYLYNNIDDIKKCFEIREEYQQEYQSFFTSNFANKRIIVAQIRLKDYKTFGPDFLNGPDLTLPFKYYHTNIKKIIDAQQDDNFQLIFMSDDIAEVKKEFKDYNAYFSEQNMMIDFQLLQHAHAAVISPSSYAWWACWLSKVDHPYIIVPKYFLGFKVNKEFPVNMIPNHFIQSEVY